MSELVLKSIYVPQDYSLTVSDRPAGIRFKFDVPDYATKGVTMSFHDARQLRDFLNKKLGEQAHAAYTEAGPWVYLDKDSHGEYFWCQFPTKEKAAEYAKHRTGRGMKNQMIARCHQTLVPVTVTTTSYEWKDL
jgi:hypothetical protein